MLWSPCNFSLYVIFLKFFFYFFNEFCRVFLTFFSFGINKLFNFIIVIWIQKSKTYVLQFPFYSSHPDSMGNWRINFKSFFRFFQLFFRRHIFQCSHIMKSICQLYNYNPNIFRHCNNHFSYIFQFFTICSRQISKFCNAIHKFFYICSKIILYIRQRNKRIFNYIMKQPSHNRICVHTHIN